MLPNSYLEAVRAMTDDELRHAIKVAKDDLAIAAADAPNSEWHQACFAGLFVYAGEASERGLTLGTVH